MRAGAPLHGAVLLSARNSSRCPDLAGGRQMTAIEQDQEQILREVERRLRREHGQPRHHNPRDPLDDLVFVALSRMTQEVKYLRTYHALRQKLSTWEEVRDAPRGQLVYLLQDAGLAQTKAQHLQDLLREVQRREGKLNLDRLKGLEDAEVEAYLITLPGVATKTARCVMLYALGCDTFPVDAHVWRVSQRLCIAQPGAWTDQRGRELESAIPAGIRASLHVTLVSHGRKVCVARSPKCLECVLMDLCPSARTS